MGHLLNVMILLAALSMRLATEKITIVLFLKFGSVLILALFFIFKNKFFQFYSPILSIILYLIILDRIIAIYDNPLDSSGSFALGIVKSFISKLMQSNLIILLNKKTLRFTQYHFSCYGILIFLST